MSESTVRIGLLVPDVMGTYGDDGNALILRERLRWRGHDAEIERLTLDRPVPESCDVYTLGGGEDSAQILASRHMTASPGLQRAIAAGRPVLAICAGLQVLGEWFAVSDGSRQPGLGVLDVTTVPQATRAIGELVVAPELDGLAGPDGVAAPLTGFENHMGATVLGPAARPLGRVRSGVGNGEPADAARGGSGARVDGVVQGSVVATYMHGPVLSRNPHLADWLLARALGVPALPPLGDRVPAQQRLRRERLAAAGVR